MDVTYIVKKYNKYLKLTKLFGFINGLITNLIKVRTTRLDNL